jgi:hypothetical protein
MEHTKLECEDDKYSLIFVSQKLTDVSETLIAATERKTFRRELFC